MPFISLCSALWWFLIFSLTFFFCFIAWNPCWRAETCEPLGFLRACPHQCLNIFSCVKVCAGAKCHIDRLMAAVSDSGTLWLVDSPLIHTPSWVIGPAHRFPARQPNREELGGRKRAGRYWLASDPPPAALPHCRHAVHTKHRSCRTQPDQGFMISVCVWNQASSHVPVGLCIYKTSIWSIVTSKR